MMCIQNVVSFCQFVLKKKKKKKPNSDCCKFAKTMIYVTNVDLFNDNEYTQFGLILSIRSQDIE